MYFSPSLREIIASRSRTVKFHSDSLARERTLKFPPGRAKESIAAFRDKLVNLAFFRAFSLPFYPGTFHSTPLELFVAWRRRGRFDSKGRDFRRDFMFRGSSPV